MPGFGPAAPNQDPKLFKLLGENNKEQQITNIKQRKKNVTTTSTPSANFFQKARFRITTAQVQDPATSREEATPASRVQFLSRGMVKGFGAFVVWPMSLVSRLWEWLISKNHGETENMKRIRPSCLEGGFIWKSFATSLGHRSARKTRATPGASEETQKVTQHEPSQQTDRW